MNIVLEKVIPTPLPKKLLKASELWNANEVFEQGQRYLICAPSGGGKSTLLNICFGLRKDYKGLVQMEERDLLSLGEADWVRMRKENLAYVFQGLRLFEDLSALDNIKLKNKLTGHKSSRAIKSMAEELDIASALDQKVASMSFGQRQRVALIRALCQPFKFLFLDEPFSHLDNDNQERAKSLIAREVRRQGAGLLFCSLGEGYHFEFDRQVNL